MIRRFEGFTVFQSSLYGFTVFQSSLYSMSSVLQALEERDKKIETLKRRLEEAVGDIENNAMLMDDVRNELGKSKTWKFHVYISVIMLLNDRL